jgi:biotin transport system substrate-specific component
MKKAIALEKVFISSTVWNLSGIIAFTALTIVGAHISIPLPFTPVPLTLQTLFVLLAGAFLGAAAGAASQIKYMVLGAAGLPVFAGGSAGGLARLLGPTGGYLVGFVAASYFLGWLLKKNDVSWTKLVLGFAAAVIIIHSLGMLRLATLLHLPLKKAFLMGSAPFLPGEAVKIILASLVYKGTKRFFG